MNRIWKEISIIKHIRTGMRFLLLCITGLFLIACTVPEHTPEPTATPVAEPTATSTPMPTNTPSPTATPTPMPIPEVSEAELLEQLEQKAGVAPESYLYADFDHDGRRELFATLTAGYPYQVWYCNSDGTVCDNVSEAALFYDACDMTTIEYAEETHVVVNLYNMMGTGKKFAIFALWNDAVTCLVPWHYGTAGTDSTGQPCMTVENYDGCYDAALDLWLMHTWKQTWLRYDKTANTYHEIAAREISEEEFLQFSNATEILESIRMQETKENTEELALSFFCQDNGIMHVQCFVKDTFGNIAARYYTMFYENGAITGKPWMPNDGIMQERLTGL